MNYHKFDTCDLCGKKTIYEDKENDQPYKLEFDIRPRMNRNFWGSQPFELHMMVLTQPHTVCIECMTCISDFINSLKEKSNDGKD